MKLEELLKNGESKDINNSKERLNRSLEIARREWNNVRKSLELAGDIGEFDKEDFMIGVIEEDVIIRKPIEGYTKSVSVYDPTFYPMYLVDNLMTMQENFEERGYSAPEALFVFIELATKGAERLGLTGSFAMSFGSGYGNVRTGWIAEKGYPVEREIFSEMFFRHRKRSYEWDFHWTSVQQKLKSIMDKFKGWQNNEALFKGEVKSPAIVKPMLV